MSERIKVAVVFGGPSAEHEISLKTGANVISALLNLPQYEVLPVKISKDGQWLINDSRQSIEQILNHVDVVFNALHGEYGEDGTFQSLLESYNVKYTGSNAKASMIGIDKVLTKVLAAQKNINSAEFNIINRHDTNIKLNLEFPVVVKPNAKGSSVGVAIVKNTGELINALEKVFSLDDQALIEKFIAGREITIGVLENYQGQKYFALPITEIIPDARFDFFDYEAKYTAGATNEVTPANLSADLTANIGKIAIEVFKAIGARHYSRIDMIVDSRNNIYVLEINTLPGLTDTSLLPQQAAIAGLPLEKLLDHLLQLTMSS